MDDAIDANGDLADKILDSALTSFGLKSRGNDPRHPSMCWYDTAESHHIDKARSTIRQMYRDWSTDGSVERQACYDPVLEDLDLEFSQLTDRCQANVLVPGAGLGRLIFEICRKGYTVEGNEISWHQLIASNWVLNHTENGETFDVYPFAAEFSNVISRDNQLKAVKVPDLHVSSVLAACSGKSEKPSSERMNMRAGDFVSLYKGDEFREHFDAVVTVFFIDTAPNIIRYIETIHSCLKKRGVWINLGPLLWHFEDRGPPITAGEKKPGRSTGRPAGIEEPGSFELTDEEVRELIRQMDFDIESHEFEPGTTGYIANPQSMLQSTYRMSHWIARKRS